MKRRHEMRFGAECLAAGGVRFNLWAPAAARVDLCLADSRQRLQLDPNGDGWFELETRAAGPGSLYKFQINRGQEVPDPASRFQPQDVHGPSEVIDPTAFDWRDGSWSGRPWSEAVIYELHVGAFSLPGTFSAVKQRLDYLADLGVTAIELMPLSDFPGKRNWGYDGVLPFAPDSVYGRPEDLKDLVQSAHARGIMMILDVVYNHFGPEANYLGVYAPQFFTPRHKTPWGNAINFDGAESRPVRDFFIANALYWLNEYRFDGLRLDAVHSLVDASTPHILNELAATVRDSVGSKRQIHLIVENERNQSSLLRRTAQCRPRAYDAQWDDDIHHTFHVLTTGEKDGYYSDYSVRPLELLARCLTSGFAYQGDVSAYGDGARRRESTEGLPLTAFVSFLQNHDQIGNRAFGERIAILAEPRAVRAATEILLLAPSVPLLFMGEEFGAKSPFLFFCDFEKELADAISAGRRNEFARFLRFNDPTAREGIPDPCAESTFKHSKLEWTSLLEPEHRGWFAFHRTLLKLRSQQILPLVADQCPVKTAHEVVEGRGLCARWNFAGGAELSLLANLSDQCVSGLAAGPGKLIYASPEAPTESQSQLPAWSVAWFLRTA
jgi:malto-oligosyltrehalose trehalohydrolase